MPELYILRHAIAEPRAHGRADETRALTPEGIEKLQWVLERARSAKVEPAAILTSPHVRAVQTAELAGKVLAPKTKLVKTEALTPGSTPEAVWSEARKHAGKGAVMVVGHEPLLGETLSFLVGTQTAVVDLKKAALACVIIDSKQKQPQGALEWLLTPKVCRPPA